VHNLEFLSTRRQPCNRRCALGLAGAALAAGLTGCGGGGGGGGGGGPQSYTLTITATSGSLSHSTTVNLTVE